MSNADKGAVGFILAQELANLTKIAIQFYKVTKILRLILHDILSQRFHSIQCNLVNKLTIYQSQGCSAIDNHIQGLQELFAHINWFLFLS